MANCARCYNEEMSWDTSHINHDCRSSKKTGFTLIELLVVISIIGLLSSIVLASLNTARAKARDAKRKEDLHQIQLALEMYYSANGQYPTDISWCDSSTGINAASCIGTVSSTWVTGGLQDIQAKGLISQMPVDPLNDASHYYYYEPVSGQTQFGITCTSPCAYEIGTYLENTSDPQASPGCITTIPSMNYCIAGGGAIMDQ